MSLAHLPCPHLQHLSLRLARLGARRPPSCDVPMGRVEVSGGEQLATWIRRWRHQIVGCAASRLERESESYKREGDQNEERDRGKKVRVCRVVCLRGVFFLARMLIPAYPCSCGRFKNPNMKINVTTYFTSRSDITN
jgi:hypothetical protein